MEGKAPLGFRVPVVVASLTRGDPANPKIDSRRYDHTSILKLIEWRWNLRPLTAGDASDDVDNLACPRSRAPDPSVPALPLPDPPATELGLIAPPSPAIGLSSLLELAPFGFRIPAP